MCINSNIKNIAQSNKNKKCNVYKSLIHKHRPQCDIGLDKKTECEHLKHGKTQNQATQHSHKLNQKQKCAYNANTKLTATEIKRKCT